MLDEASLRKPGFTEGARVTLADGGEWVLPKPRPVFFPTASPGEGIGLAVRFSYGLEYDPYFEEAFGPRDDGDFADEVEAKMRLAALLLLANYDLDDGRLADLLTLRAGSEGSLAMWAALNRAIYEQAALVDLAEAIDV
jgi:hypothetical protein